MSQTTVPVVLCLCVVLLLASLSSFTLAATFEEVAEQQDYKMRHGIPAASILYTNPYASPSAVEKLMLLRAAALENLGPRPLSFHKKFDSLSGGTFGMQKRQYSPFEA